MILYSGKNCPFSHRCRFLIYEKNIDDGKFKIDFNKDFDDIALLNPYQLLPILVEDPLILHDFSVIVEYLEDRFPDRSLLPKIVEDRARVRQYIRNFEINFDQPMAILENRGLNASETQRKEAREKIRDGLTTLALIFKKDDFLSQQQFGIIDIFFAPLIWRLQKYDITISDPQNLLQKYSERLFSRSAFTKSLTFEEQIR